MHCNTIYNTVDAQRYIRVYACVQAAAVICVRRNVCAFTLDRRKPAVDVRGQKFRFLYRPNFREPPVLREYNTLYRYARSVYGERRKINSVDRIKYALYTYTCFVERAFQRSHTRKYYCSAIPELLRFWPIFPMIRLCFVKTIKSEYWSPTCVMLIGWILM